MVMVFTSRMQIKGRYCFLDLLRAVAAVSVVLFHLIEGQHVPGLALSHPVWAAIAGRGYLGVSIFFVLSGFVISHSLYAREIDGRSILRFMMKRSIRLDPPYWVALGLTMAAAYASATLFTDKPPLTYSWAQVASHILYLQDVLGYRPIGGVFWTLCLELQFYVVYAAVLLVAYRLFHTENSVALAVATAAIVSLAFPLGLTPRVSQSLFLPLWYGFLAGALCYWAWRRPRLVPLFALFLAGIGYAAARGDAFAAACLATAALVYLVAIAGRLGQHLGWPVAFLANISFSLYLIHNPVTGASFRMAYRVLGHGASSEPLALAFALGVNILAATAFWMAIERPCLKLATTIGRAERAQPRMLDPRKSDPRFLPATLGAASDIEAPTRVT